MQTLTAEEFKKKYGVIGASQFDPTPNKDNLFSEIKQAFTEGIGTIGQGIQEAAPVGSGGVGGLVTGVGKILGGATQAITSPIAPIMNRTVSPAINAAGVEIGKIPAVQKFAVSPAGEVTSKVAETVGNYANAAGLVAGGMVAPKSIPKFASKASEVTESIPKPSLEKLGAAQQYLKGAIRDVTPTRQNWIDSSLAKALDLTQGDLKNISASTGNEVGRWMADNNLIGTNKANTQGLVESFFKQNYDAVRGEISKVKQVYKASEIPRFTETLKAIGAETQGKLGLEKTNREIASLLKKEEVSLEDVQRAKELLDEHFSLYKITGDVASGVAKEGLANVRSELKSFIEQQVLDNTGADIGAMNNNVATARTLSNAITDRSQRGLTRTHITNRDITTGLGLTYFATPFVGLAYVFMRKLWESPTIRLRVARYLDQLNDAQRAVISENIKNGNVPKALQEIAGPLSE